MADYPISNVPRRVQYVNSGVGPYAFTFEILVQTDIAVYRGSTLLTLTTDYTVAINANGTGSITLVVAGTGNITIVGARAIQRSSDYTTGGDLFASTLNTDLDSQTIYSQQLAETLDRTIKVPVTDASTLDMQLPSSTARANKVFGFDSSGAPQASTNTLAAIDAAVDTIESIASAPSGNSAGISHIASGSGAVATTVQAKLREIVSLEDFGAVGDNVADDTVAIQNAVSYCAANNATLTAKKGSYKITSTVSFRNISIDFTHASINVAHSGIGVTIGGNASSPNNPTQRFNSITRSVGTDSTTTPTVRAVGVKGQHIYLNRTTYFQVYADTHNVGDTALRNTDYSSAYSSFWLKYVDNIELTNNPANAGGPNDSNPGGTIQWINENEFYLNRTNSILINGTYIHNHNKFYGGTFEGIATINWDVARDTILHGARFESGPTNITFGSGSARNVIEKTWTSSENIGTIFSPIVTGTIVDNGVQNQVYDYRGQQYTKAIVASASVTDPVINNIVSPGARDPLLQRLYSGSGGFPCVSEYIPLVPGDQYSFNLSGADSGDDAAGYRPVIRFYDKNLQPVTPSADWISSATITSVSGNTLTIGVGVSGAAARITNNGFSAGAVYIQVLWRSLLADISKALARNLTIVRMTKSSVSNLPNPVPAFYAAKLPVVSAIPTQGFVPLGYTAIDSDGLSLYINTFALDTTLSAGASSGDTSISVTSGASTVNGDIIGINQDNRSTHWTTIASGGGTTSITLTAALTANAASGSRVVFNRWVTK